MSASINVLYNVCYCDTTTSSVVANLGRKFYTVQCSGTKEQVTTAYNTWQNGQPVANVVNAIKQYFPYIKLPCFSNFDGAGEQSGDNNIDMEAIFSLCSSSGEITTPLATDTRVWIRDVNGYGFNAVNFGTVVTPTGSYAVSGVSGQTKCIGISRVKMDNNRAWTVAFNFITTDGYYGAINLSRWKTNSRLAFANAENSLVITNWLSGIPVPDNDPYTNENGSSAPNGAGGITYAGIVNDDIDFPTPPTASAANANFISIWTPTLDQIQDLAKWMWNTDPTKWNFWQKLLQNPLELIFSLSILPIPIHHTDDTGEPTEEELVALNDSLSLGWQDTGLKMDWVTEQYVTIDMGSIDIEEVWGAFLDYEPYTKIDIFLPYIGVKQLDTNDCMPRTISLKYIIDIATGTCIALVKCDNSVYYHFSGNCASQIPITVNQCQEIVRGLMTMVVGAATFAIGGPVGAGAHASKAAIAKGVAMKTAGAAMIGSGADNAAKGVTVSRSGTISCAAGLMDIQTPYLIISRPRQAVPTKQNKYTGYPSFMTKQIGELVGYSEIQIIHLENMTCTDEEYDEINELLLEGVII